jgi:hypothetical protein
MNHERDKNNKIIYFANGTAALREEEHYATLYILFRQHI